MNWFWDIFQFKRKTFFVLETMVHQSEIGGEAKVQKHLRHGLNMQTSDTLKRANQLTIYLTFVSSTFRLKCINSSN